MKSGHMLAGKTVVVAGGGIAGAAFGLCLLRLCREQGVSPLPEMHVYERDAQLTARAGEGYSLSVKRSSGGLQVLERLGLLDELLAYEEPGKAMSLATASFHTLCCIMDTSDAKAPTNDLRISRAKLREVLVQRLPPQLLSYSKTCTTCKIAPDLDNGKKPVEVQFQDGSTMRCDLLVAADGSASKLRACLRPEEKMRSLGAAAIMGVTEPFDPLPAELAKGCWIALASNGCSLFLGTLDKTRAFWSVGFYTASQGSFGAARLEKLQRNPDAHHDELVKLLKGKTAEHRGIWQTILQNTPAGNLRIFTPMDKLPHSNAAHPNVVFIGDSCHAMVPYSGEGANMALCDALSLAQQLLDPQHDTLAAAVAAYDAESMPRSRNSLEGGRRMFGTCHRTGVRYRATIAALWCVGWLMSVSGWLLAGPAKGKLWP